MNTGRTPAPADGVGERRSRRRAHGEAGMALEVSDWPGGVEPVWSLLEPESARALRDEPLAGEGAVYLAEDLTEAELPQSAFLRNALALLEEMDGGDVRWIGTNGNLKMTSVTKLRGLMSWPGMEATEQFREGKTYREQAIGELHLLRLVVERAGLIRSSALWFELTPSGRAMLEPGGRGGLQALLFREAFWHMDLSNFVNGKPRNLPGWWPQGDVGTVLWSLSVVVDEWRKARTLTALCTVADDSISTVRSNPAATMFARHILDPLRWFGLVECRMADVPDRYAVAQDRPVRPLAVVRRAACETSPGWSLGSPTTWGCEPERDCELGRGVPDGNDLMGASSGLFGFYGALPQTPIVW